MIIGPVAIAAHDANVYHDLTERILKQHDKDPETVPTLLHSCRR